MQAWRRMGPSASRPARSEPPAPADDRARSRPRARFDRPALIGAILAAATLALSLSNPADFDLWWHLAVGRFVVARHALPVPDPFSFTAAGRSWIAHEWLAELLLFGLYDALGITGVSAAFGLVAAATVLVSLRTLRRRGGELAAIAGCGLVIFSLQPYLGPRPQVLAFFAMALLVDALDAWADGRSGTPWWLVALFCGWANVHGSFVVGLGLLAWTRLADGIAARLGGPLPARRDGRQRRALAILLGASTLTTLVNPSGFALLVYPLTKLHNPVLGHLEEWKSLDPGDVRSWGFVALALAAVAIAAVRRPRLDAASAAVGGLFTLAAFWSLRFVPFAALAIAPIAAGMLAEPRRPGAPARRPAAAHGESAREVLRLAVFALAAAALLASADRYDPDSDPRLPRAAVDALGAEGLRGPLFHPYEWGGYLIWRLAPEVRVFIDGRGDDLYMAGGELAAYADAVEGLGRSDEVLDRYRIRTILFPRDTPFVRSLVAGGRWRVTFEAARVVRLERVPGAAREGAVP